MAALVIAVAAIMPHARERSKRGCMTRARRARTFSAKRNGVYKQIVVMLSLHATAGKWFRC